jgi:hypothetical protein
MIKTIIIAVAAMIFAPLGLGGTAHPVPGQADHGSHMSILISKE